MPLSTILFLIYLAAAVFLTLQDWRRGPFFTILAAALQDPLRKLHPGAPAWFVLSIAPIFGAMLLGSIQEIPGWWARFRWYENPVATGILVFSAGLVIPVFVSLTYGIPGIKLALMGGFFYGTALVNVVLGFYYGYQTGMLRKLIMFHVLVTAIMLIGVVLEYRDVFPEWDALGTKVLGNIWIRYIPGYQIRMISGFYRSPDIMGWHATMMVMACLVLAFSSRESGWKILWMLLSGWGIVGTYLCGRRKFFYMLPIFGLALLWLNRRQLGRFAPQSIIAMALACAVFVLGYERIGPYEDVEVYYFQTVSDAVVRANPWAALLETFSNPYHGGFFGKGLGAAATGAHHVSDPGKPRTWQEGGLERLAVELGVPGFLCALFLAVTTLRRALRVGDALGVILEPDARLYTGVLAMAAANGASFVVSGQIFGDPFVGFFFSLVVGAVLAGELALAPAESAPPVASGPSAGGTYWPGYGGVWGYHPSHSGWGSGPAPAATLSAAGPPDAEGSPRPPA